MSKENLVAISVFVGCVAVASVADAQAPRIVNGQVSNRPAGTLTQTFRELVSTQSDVGWIGYAVAARDADQVMCCWSSGDTYISGSMRAGEAPCCGFCRIEPAAERDASTARAPASPAAAKGPVKLEGSGRMIVMFRVAAKQVERVRVFSEECELDAGGRPVTWLDGVQPADSIALLESLIDATQERKGRITGAALHAIAQHAEPSAGPVLERLARNHATPGVRGEALFWIAQRGDANASSVILTAIDKDPAADVRKRAVFALSQLRNDAGVDPLIRVARGHADSAVRSEAIFWLGQKAGKRAAGTITEAIEKDPETEVKRRAVFALSQLPKDEGVPLLIDVARKNSNPAVRKQAIFWLGQSKDPRAIEFFAEILK